MKSWTLTLTVNNEFNSDGVPAVEQMPIAMYGVSNMATLRGSSIRLEQLLDETKGTMYENGKALMPAEVEILTACIEHLKALEERQS